MGKDERWSEGWNEAREDLIENMGWEPPPGHDRPCYCLMPLFSSERPPFEKCKGVIIKQVNLPRVDDPTGWAKAPTSMREVYCDFCDHAPDVRPEDEDPTEDPSREYFYGPIFGWVSEHEHEQIQEEEERKAKEKWERLTPEEQQEAKRRALRQQEEDIKRQKELERKRIEEENSPYWKLYRECAAHGGYRGIYGTSTAVYPEVVEKGLKLVADRVARGLPEPSREELHKYMLKLHKEITREIEEAEDDQRDF